MFMSKKKSELFQYILIMKKEKPENINYISFLLCFISWIFFLYYTYAYGSFSSVLFWVNWLIPVVLVWTIRVKRKFNKAITYKHPLFVTGCLWLLVPGMRWIAILFILFIFFYHQSRHPMDIVVSDEKIVINTFFRKRYQWHASSNVVLKDGLLTLDFKNNRMLQREIIRHDVNESEFNDFCLEQLDLK